jgi:hypothetical protein
MTVTAENKAGQVLQQVNQQVNEVEGKTSQANAKIAETTQKMNVNVLGTAQAFAGLGAGAVGLATSFDILERAQLKVDIANKNMISAQATAIQTQESLNNAVAKFGPDSEQAQQALLRMEAAQQQVSIAQDKARLAQDQLGDTYANFAANLGPQVISLIFGMQGAFRALGITSVSQLIPAIRGIGTVLTTTFLTNPIGVVIIGIATAVALFATNAFGLRDAIFKLGEEIFKFTQQHLKPLADLLTWLNVNVIQPVAQVLGLTTVESTKAAEEAFHDLDQETIDLGRGIAATSQQLEQDLIPALDPRLTSAGANVTEALRGTEAVIAKNIEQFGAMGRTALDTATNVETGMEVVTESVKNVRSEIENLNKHFEEARVKAFGAAQGNIDAFRQVENIHVRDIADRIGSLGLTDQDLRAALQLSGVSATQEQAGILSSPKFQNAVMKIALGRRAKQGEAFLTEQGLDVESITKTVLPRRKVTQDVTVRGIGLGAYQLDILARQALIANIADAIRSGTALEDLDIASMLQNIREVGAPAAAGVNIFAAQHGFNGFINRPTMFLAGEAGMEHVKVTPMSDLRMNKRSGTFVFEIDGRAFAEAIIDDIDELLTSSTVPKKLKLRGVRLQ